MLVTGEVYFWAGSGYPKMTVVGCVASFRSGSRDYNDASCVRNKKRLRGLVRVRMMGVVEKCEILVACGAGRVQSDKEKNT